MAANANEILEPGLKEEIEAAALVEQRQAYTKILGDGLGFAAEYCVTPDGQRGVLFRLDVYCDTFNEVSTARINETVAQMLIGALQEYIGRNNKVDIYG